MPPKSRGWARRPSSWHYGCLGDGLIFFACPPYPCLGCTREAANLAFRPQRTEGYFVHKLEVLLGLELMSPAQMLRWIGSRCSSWSRALSWLWISATLAQYYDPVNDFCRRFGHQSAVVDRRLYIDGGLAVGNPLSPESQNFTGTSPHDLSCPNERVRAKR